MAHIQGNPEKERLLSCQDDKTWKKWGPYLSERQWGTVREDYSPTGDSWHFVSHDKARSNAYRWGEEGIAGFCETDQILCLAPAFWNGKDPILKERLFGLTNNQGNHGEDVKELYFHLDSSPTHSYSKYLYKYPQAAFPYEKLIKKNQIGRDKAEYEILDTGVFANGKYFDCEVEYAKANFNDILLKITVHNRSSKAHAIHVIPHIWFRNFWKHNPRYERPEISQDREGVLITKSSRNGKYHFYYQKGEALFCENETNNERIYKIDNDVEYVKDGINNHIIDGADTVNPLLTGTKAGVWHKDTIEGGGLRIYRVRLSKRPLENPWRDFEAVFKLRKSETDLFYRELTPSSLNPEQKKLLRDALGGLMWTKQFYYFDVHKWLNGGPGEDQPYRVFKRNSHWQHLTNRDVISMPDIKSGNIPGMLPGIWLFTLLHLQKLIHNLPKINSF